MPTIEERAQRCRTDTATVAHPWAVEATRIIDALLSTLDAERAAHAQFRQEVSDVARDAVAMLDEMAKPLLMGRNVKERLEKARSGLEPLIIAKPDPLVEAVRDCGYATLDAIEPEFAADLRAALAARGLKLVEVGDAD